MESNSIPRTERYSLTLRQLVQWGCQKTLMGADMSFTSARIGMDRERQGHKTRHGSTRRETGCSTLRCVGLLRKQRCALFMGAIGLIMPVSRA